MPVRGFSSAVLGPKVLNKCHWETHAFQMRACLELHFSRRNPSKLLPSGQRRLFAWFEVPADIYRCANVKSGTFHCGHCHRKSPSPAGADSLSTCWALLRTNPSSSCSVTGHPTPCTRPVKAFHCCYGYKIPWSFCRTGTAVPAMGDADTAKSSPTAQRAACSSPSPRQACGCGKLLHAVGSDEVPWGWRAGR